MLNNLSQMLLKIILMLLLFFVLFSDQGKLNLSKVDRFHYLEKKNNTLLISSFRI